MFITRLFEDPIYYLSVVMVVTLSIVLHELGHAFAAIWEGDETPRKLGHVTLNPLIHMGPMALGALFLVGISWGQCPVEPRNFRHGKKGDAFVSFAGPATNLVLMVLFTVALVAWASIGLETAFNPHFPENVAQFLWLGAMMNGVLFLLNMIPVPPLDGFSVASALSTQFARSSGWISRNAMPLFLLIFIFGAPLLFGASESMINGLIGGLGTLTGFTIGG